MDSIVYRIEWKGKGPFWLDGQTEEIEKACKKIAKPEKKMMWECDTFIDYYLANATSPHDYNKMSECLCRGQVGMYKFGFNSIDALMYSLGFKERLYVKQFMGLFETGHFKVRACLVEWVDYHKTETLYLASSEQLVEEASTAKQFLNM